MMRPFAHPVTCCCVLLGVVAQSTFEIGQTLSYLQMEATTSSNVPIRLQKFFMKWYNTGNKEVQFALLAK